MRNKFLLLLIPFFALASLFGIGHSSWVKTEATNNTNEVEANFPTWTFLTDTDFARYDNVGNTSNITVTKEYDITQGSNEAIRITNTAGTSTVDHTINIAFDRDYYLSEIRFYKFEFDYYHKYKREQNTKGFPKVVFTVGNSTIGTEQGGTDTVNEKSSFVATNIDNDWWHLEYFVFAHMPTMADHQDTPIGLTKKVNGVRIIDRTIYDYASTTAYVVIDNMQFNIEPASRLGIFNRGTSWSNGTYYWFKIAFSGELHSCVITTSDPTIAIQDTDSEKSPFYILGLKKGKVTATATLVVGRNHTVLTISNTLTVN